jgi:predicted metalloprotease with PDZ domain
MMSTNTTLKRPSPRLRLASCLASSLMLALTCAVDAADSNLKTPDVNTSTTTTSTGTTATTASQPKTKDSSQRPPQASRGLEPVRYRVSFPAPRTHYLEVEATFPTDRKPEIDLTMAVWTPGSYLVREYERNVENVAARGPNGQTLALAKTRKNHWRVTTGGAPQIVVSYRVYSREMSVRNNWVEDTFALLNGAQTFITLLEPHAKRAHDVQLTLPAEWKKSVTGLPSAPDGAAHHYVAEDYDTLVDSPIVAGNPTVYEFEVSGKKHYLVNQGEAGVWDGPRSARDVEKIVREAERFWGSLPYEKYVFFNLLTEGGGGLEHRNSCTLMASRWRTGTRDGYLGWLGLVSHEFFHAWNVKRLRPIELGPFDYENEVHTASLWVAEGITDYYGALLVRRAGLSTDTEYLKQVSEDIRDLQATPGRLVQPVEAASYDAWIKYYRPDENSPNVTVSYYTKGAIIGFLLDAKIRKATNGAKSLDDVMRLAFQRFSGPKGYTPDDFRKTVQDVAGVGAGAAADLGDWWRKTLDTTEELDYTEAVDWYGLHFTIFERDRRDRNGNGRGDNGGSGGANDNGNKAWLGLTTRSDNGRLLVSQVRRGTPGYDAGFSVDDEILAIGDFRVRPDQLSSRLEQYRPGQTVAVLVARRDELTRIIATFGREPEERWKLEPAPNTTAAQQQQRQAWMTGPARQ